MGKAILIGLLSIICLMGLGYGMKWFKVFETSTVGAAQKDAERKVFENTDSYVLGKRQELSKYMYEYKTAVADGETAKAEAIKQTIRISFAEFDASKLSPELESFLNSIRY